MFVYAIGNINKFTKAVRTYLAALSVLSHSFSLTHLRNANGSVVVAATPGANDFIVASTPGTSLKLTGHAAQNNTKTDAGYFEYVIPPAYVAGSALSVIINAQRVVAGGTAGTCTVVPLVHKQANDGTQGSNLVTTAAAALTTTATDFTFAVTSTSLLPGDKLIVRLATSVQETANGGTVTAAINSVRLTSA